MKTAFGLLACSAAALGASDDTHKVVRNTTALEFTYEWPAEAVAISALDLRLYREAKRDFAEAERNAREDQGAGAEGQTRVSPALLLYEMERRGRDAATAGAQQ
jgi:hypothetical protein